MGNYVDKNNNITCPEKVKIKGQVYKFTGRIDWSKHYPIPVYKKMSKILNNLDGTIQNLWDKGKISLNLKHYLEIEVQKKATALLDKLCNEDLESIDGDKLTDLIYEHIGDVDAR